MYTVQYTFRNSDTRFCFLFLSSNSLNLIPKACILNFFGKICRVITVLFCRRNWIKYLYTRMINFGVDTNDVTISYDITIRPLTMRPKWGPCYGLFINVSLFYWDDSCKIHFALYSPPPSSTYIRVVSELLQNGRGLPVAKQRFWLIPERT